MSLQIYNTMTRSKEDFEPIAPPEVTIYNCGPTVYDHFHIGNARNFVVMDMVRRYFEYAGYKVKFVQNLTDIDDKIINKANDEGVEWSAITDRFIPCYFEDADKLRIRRADVHPKATEHIEEMLNLISNLIDKGLAYAADGSVYFRVKAFESYGKLSGRKLEDMLEGARVEVSDVKESAGDFALWKGVKPGEPSWPSPWGPGRPGWHIECSAMAIKHLGETIDIHAGGTDLTFPHHENEIAQSEGCTGKTFARFWMHNGFLNIDNEKMSKSKGNFFKIDQILARYPTAAVRHFLLSAHYRSPLDLTDHAMDESLTAVRRINDTIETSAKLLAMEKADASQLDADAVNEWRERFEAAMNDDFNSPRALAVLFGVVNRIHELRRDTKQNLATIAALCDFARQLRDFFSIELTEVGSDDAGESAACEGLIELLITSRKTAREAKAFEIADAVRDQLGEAGVALEDHPQGTIWKRSGDGPTLDGLMTLLIEVRQMARKAKVFAIADAIRDGLAPLGLALEDHPQGTIWKRIDA